MENNSYFLHNNFIKNRDNLFLDALTCTIRSVPQSEEHELSFIDLLARYLGATIVDTSKGQSSYPNMILLQGEREKRRFNIRCRYGASGINMNMSIACTGFISEEFKNALRELDVWYYITRADIAIDWEGDFEEWHSHCKEFRVQRGLKSGTIGDWEDGEDGRTYNMGSRKSESYCRLYEKGIEMSQKGFNGVPCNLLRLELEFKPIKEKRELIQDFDLVHLLSKSKVGTDLFNKLFSLGIKPTKTNYTVKDDIWESLSHVAIQYRRHFQQAISENGWEAVHDAFSHVWELQDIGSIT